MTVVRNWMALRPAKDKVVGTENATIRSWADTVHGARFQVNQDSTRDIFATWSFIVVDIDAFQLKSTVADVFAFRIDSMFIRDYLPELQKRKIPNENRVNYFREKKVGVDETSLNRCACVLQFYILGGFQKPVSNRGRITSWGAVQADLRAAICSPTTKTTKCNRHTTFYKQHTGKNNVPKHWKNIYLGSDLVATLTGLKMDDFPHFVQLLRNSREWKLNSGQETKFETSFTRRPIKTRARNGVAVRARKPEILAS